MFQEYGLPFGDWRWSRSPNQYGGFRYTERKDSGRAIASKAFPWMVLDAVGAGNPRTFGVEFDTIAPDLCVAGDQMQRSSLSDAGVDH